jgi:predicted RND superfamily exporter protein
MERLARAIVGRPWVVIGVVGVLTVLFAWAARHTRIDSSVGTLVDVTDPAVAYYEDVQRSFGTEEADVVAVVAEDVFTPATLAKIETLTARLLAIRGVAGVVSLANARNLTVTPDGDIDTAPFMPTVPRAPEAVARLRAAVHKNPLVLGSLVSADGRAAALLVTYDRMSDAEFLASGVHDEVERVVESAAGPERTYLSGGPTLKVEAAEFIESDVGVLVPIGFAVMCAVLLLAFRTLRGMVLPALTTAIGVVWTVGFMAWCGVPIDVGTLTLPTLLIAVGNAYATHVVARYYEEAVEGGSGREVVQRIIGHLGVPVLITALTTLLGFASLLAYRIAAIRNLGLFSVFGIAAMLVLALTFTTAMLAVLRVGTVARTRAEEENTALARGLCWLGRVSMDHRTVVLLGTAVILGVVGWGIRYVRVETAYLSYFPADAPVSRATRAIADHLGTGQAPFLVVVDGPAENAVVRLDALRRIAALQDFIDRLPGIDRTTSLVDYVELLHRIFHDDDPAYFRLPDTDAAVQQYLLLLDPEMLEGVVSDDYARAAIGVRSHLHNSAEMAAAVARIERFAADAFPAGFSVQVTGTTVLLDRTADDLAQGQVWSVLTALIVVFVILSLQFLSPRFGLVAMAPNLVPIVIFFGVLGWTGTSLSLVTAMIASIALGIGVDEAIHLLAEFNHHVRRHADQRAAVLAALRSVGPPVFYNTAALSLGFSVLLWSNFAPLRQFGALSALNVAASLLSDLLLLPAVLISARFVTLWDVLGLKLGAAPQEAIPLFRGLRPAQARVAALMGVLRTVARGQRIVRQGDPASDMYVIIRGRARAERITDGRAAVLGEIERGGVIGEMGVVRDRPRSADVVALEETDLLVVDDRFLGTLRRRYPRIASTVLFNLTHILSDRLERADVQLPAAAPPTGGP